jgi:deazaflavin-dependent oxidoreductase (nitroreductase family)
MPATASAQRPDTHDMVVIHRAFRREISLMPQLIQSVPDGDGARARVIAEQFADYQLGLHFHHSGEDELIWPLLLARVDLEAETVLRMEAQHDVIARTLKAAAQRIARWQAAPSLVTAGPLLAALAEHRAAVTEHLRDEEDHILPLVEQHLTQAEWDRLGERFAAEIPKNKMLFFLGLILEDATPAEREQLTSHLPVPARLAWQVIGKRQYSRKIAKIRGGLDPRVPPVPPLARWMNRHLSPDKSAPDSFLRFHCWLYRRSGGRAGHGMIGAPCLILTTTGRKTRQPRVSALVYARDGDRYVVAASNDARPRNPGWLYNIQAEPRVRLQVARRKLAGTARVIERADPAYQRCWDRLNAVSGGRYDRYQARTARHIPVVVIDPEPATAWPPPGGESRPARAAAPAS